MVRHVQPPEAETPDDLDSTSELPCLDVAAHEEQLARNGSAVEDLARNGSAIELSDAHGLDRARPLPVLPPVDTLQDIEAWIAAQDARTHAYQRSLEDLHKSRAEAYARAESLAIELGIAQQALQTARTHDGQRTAVDETAAAAGALDSHTESSHDQLAQTRLELAASVERLGAAEVELRELREELARRQEHIDMLQRAGGTQHSVAAQLAQERDALAGRLAMLAEHAQSSAWRRSFWESLWQEQDGRLAELTEEYARAHAERAELRGALDRASAELTEQRARAEAERAQLRSALDRTGADLVARESTIAHLQEHDATQHAALEELGETRTRELHEVRTVGETLAAEFKALEERHRVSVEALKAREAELAAARAAQNDLSDKVSRLEANESAHGARTVELEALVGSLTHALQRQTEAAQHAQEQLVARDRELIEVHGRAGTLESRLETTLQQLSEQAARSQASEAALTSRGALLASGEERQRALEQEAATQTERMTQLQSELAAARSAVIGRESERQARENELAQLRDTQQREVARAEALEKEQRDLTLELGRTRGALDERDLQLRRLERYANNSAQVLNRIQEGMQRAATARPPDTQATDHPACLVSMDDDSAPVLPLGRRTVIGRAPGNDVCIMDTSVSRRHAAVTIGPNGAFIEDLRSINGVRLNQRRVGVAKLADGDVIELGTKKFRFTSARHPPRAAETG